MNEDSKWTMRELIAKAMAYQSVGDPHAVTVEGKQRWEWFIETAERFISVFGYKFPEPTTTGKCGELVAAKKELLQAVKFFDDFPPSIQSMSDIRVVDAAHKFVSQAEELLAAKDEEIDNLKAMALASKDTYFSMVKEKNIIIEELTKALEEAKIIIDQKDAIIQKQKHEIEFLTLL